MNNQRLTAILDYDLLGNSLADWAIALAIALLCYLVFYLIKCIGVSRFARLAAKTETLWDDAIAEALAKTNSLMLIVFCLFLGSLFLDVSDDVHTVIFSVAYAALILQAGLWMHRAFRYWLKYEAKRRREKDPSTVGTLTAVAFIGRLVLWSMVTILLLDNLGVDVTALVAGLGIGGIAVALAVQNILGDLFASMSIMLDKPFRVGDFLIISEHMGAVEHIGLKTTRIRSLSGEQLVFSNTDLLSSRIRNFGRMFERRVVFKLNVTYQTPRDKLKIIPGMIREIIEAQQLVRFDRAHFQAFAAASLDFEIVYYVLASDYNTYMDIQQAINLEIHERFEQEGIEFAYPTQTLYLHNANEASVS